MTALERIEEIRKWANDGLCGTNTKYLLRAFETLLSMFDEETPYTNNTRKKFNERMKG